MAQQTPTTTVHHGFELRYEDLPALYQSADRYAVAVQRQYLISVRVRLIALVIASGTGVLAWLLDLDAIADVVPADPFVIAGGVAALAFVVALISEYFFLHERPDRSWHVARASAESIKSLAWLYTVGGRPFGRDESNDQRAEVQFLEGLSVLVDELRPHRLLPTTEGTEQISETMRQVRAGSLDQRRELYRRERLEDQQRWYALKARSNDRGATHWSMGLALGELAGFFAIVVVFLFVDAERRSEWLGILLGQIGLFGLVAAFVAAAEAWLQTRQHHRLATTYSAAAHDLSILAGRLTRVETEDEWAAFVAEAESLISKEHTLWRAVHA